MPGRRRRRQRRGRRSPRPRAARRSSVSFEADRPLRALPRQRRRARHADRHLRALRRRRRAAGGDALAVRAGRAPGRLRRVRRRGPRPRDAVRRMRRARTGRAASARLRGRRARPGSPTGSASASPAAATRASAAARPATSTSLVHVRAGRALPARRRRPRDRLDVPAPLAALGATLERRRRSTASVDVEVPAGTQPGAVLTVGGKGMPRAAPARAPRRPARGGQRRRSRASSPSDQRALLEQLRRHDDRREPARRRVAARQAAPSVRTGQGGQGGRDPPGGARPRASRPSSCSPSCSSWRRAGWRRATSTGDVVEYAVYGAPGELPDLPDLRAAAGGGAGRGHHERGADDWNERWQAFHRPVRIGDRCSCARRGSRRARGLLDVVIDPAQAFGTGAHPTTRLCLELLLELEPAAARSSTSAAARACWPSPRPGWAGGRCSASTTSASRCRRRSTTRAPTACPVQARRHDLLRDGPAPGAPTVLANLLRPLLLRVAREGFAGAQPDAADRQRAARPRGRRGRRRLRPPRPARDARAATAASGSRCCCAGDLAGSAPAPGVERRSCPWRGGRPTFDHAGARRLFPTGPVGVRVP